ncbi:MAG: oxygenase MpaB family protein [Acidimicrobiales bacterium]
MRSTYREELSARLRTKVNRSIRQSVGLTQEPPPRCVDPDLSYFPVDGVARIVHGDLSSMLVGGIGSLFFQMLHPHAMAGVAQHSRYQHDPFGRLLQTANFIGTTTYGTKSAAYASIERVLAVHEGVRGTADDGVPYYANDPHLLAWVHAAETSMFLRGYLRFGKLSLTRDQCDTYVAEMSRLAIDLGAENPPTTMEDLDETLRAFRPELRLSNDGVIGRDFVQNGFSKGPVQRVAYRLLVLSAVDLLEPWARELLDVRTPPRLTRQAIRVATHLLCATLRVFVPPATPVAPSLEH